VSFGVTACDMVVRRASSGLNLQVQPGMASLLVLPGFFCAPIATKFFG